MKRLMAIRGAGIALAMAMTAAVTPSAASHAAGHEQASFAGLAMGDRIGMLAAHIGDGSSPGYRSQQTQLQHAPGYSVGTGAYVGDGSDPNYLNDQRELRNEPGDSYGAA